jgi:2-hydroxy-6-oxonona-2,4-dienedioate hydrolase
MTNESYSLKEIDHIRYAEAGEGTDGTPVLLLHGMMGDISNWESVFKPISEAGHRVLCPILPVYSLPIRKATLQGVIDFIVDFTDRLGIDKAIVAGNSLGGHVAAMYAIQFPERVEGLILTGASGIYEVEMSTSIMRRKDREYLRPRVAKTFFDPSHCTEELLDDVIEIINNREKALRLIRFARSVEQNPVKDDLVKIQAPTLLVWGKNDEITPPDVARTFHEGIKNSELCWLDECGHVPMLEQPEGFNAEVVRFLKNISVAKSAS